ncbi:aldo/keto reductase [Halonotius terrestris]|uniref:Aldo/keto reductase n=1 Tax=Halonotius terrestris TaxID=2487750 RepID=A0A8J8TCK4_9EURY|nr:aldo/keto reductase [Halonotius terrestris]TQQ83410.1 aldo/keto reductase [Halonotius terrestris]
MATESGTWGYRDRFGDSFGRTYFRRFPPGVCSSIGIGTYLGEPTDAVDDDYRAAITAALDGGINMVDTAINYRCQRGERVVGDALADSDIDRESVVLATKGGFLPFDGERPAEPGRYIHEQYVEPGIVDTDHLVRGSHSIEAGVIDHLLDRSLSNLGVETIDCYYVHNPETQLLDRDPEAVYDSLEATFELLERRRAAGDIGCYGLATWEAFRVPESAEQYLSLATVLDRAERAADAVGVDDHCLKAIQLPFNIEMADAFTLAAQPAPPGSDGDGPVSVLEYAHAAGLHVVTSASLGQGALADSIPPAIAAELAGDTTAQRAINFARSAPGVTTALVGMSSSAHVAENIAAGTFDPLGASAFDAIFE